MRDTNSYIIGIDVGGTKTRVGLLNSEGKLIQLSLGDKVVINSKFGNIKLYEKGMILTYDTPTITNYPKLNTTELQELLIEILVNVINQLFRLYPSFPVEAITVAFAGKVEEFATITKAADVYGKWGDWSEKKIKKQRQSNEKFFLKQRLQNKFPQINIFVINDVVAAAWRYGLEPKYKDYKTIAVLTLSTGIGYSLFDIQNPTPEGMDVVSLGHYTVNKSPHALLCDCGGKGHLASYASGKALNRIIKNKQIKSVTNIEEFALALKENDPQVHKIFNELTAKLANSIYPLLELPIEKIILMGGMAQSFKPWIIEAFEATFKTKYQENRISGLLDWAKSDDADGVIGSMLAYMKSRRQSGVFPTQDEFGNTGYYLSNQENEVINIYNEASFDIKNGQFINYLSLKEVKKVLIITDDSIKKSSTRKVSGYLKTYGMPSFVYKIVGSDTVAINQIINTAKEFGMGRKDAFIILGSKAAKNVGGFGAAIYRRGIRYIHVEFNDNLYQAHGFYVNADLENGYTASLKHPPMAIFYSGEVTPSDINYTTLDKYAVLNVKGLFDFSNPTLSEYIGNNKQALFVIDTAVNYIYGARIRNYLDHYEIQHDFYVYPGGEQDKTISTIVNIFEQAKKGGITSDHTIVSIGGGITLDISGFAAAMIGAHYIKIPTTLVGMIDAGIGIKVGYNANDKKNYLGDFYAPKVCLNDVEFLKTTSVKDIRLGLAEIIKMGIMVDSKIILLVENYYDSLINNRFQNGTYANEVRDRAIYSMLCELQTNLYENKTLERLVDFGHTFSPYIEIKTHYLREHGEAVAIDMALSTQIAFLQGRCNKAVRNRIVNLLLKIGLPIFDNQCDPQEIYNSLEDTRLHRGGKLNLPIPTKIGKGIFIQNITLEELNSSLKYLEEISERDSITSWKEMFNQDYSTYSAAFRNESHNLWVEDEDFPSCGKDEIIIMMLVAGICGTDKRVYSGERPVPAGRIGHEACAVILAAGFDAQKLGYKKGSVVVLDCNNPNPSKRDNHLDGVFGQIYKIPSDFVISTPQRRVIPIDEHLQSNNLSLAAAGILEPLTVALHGLDYLRIGKPISSYKYNQLKDKIPGSIPNRINRVINKNVVITGAGNIAVFFAMFLRINGAKKIIMINRNNKRLEKASKIAKPDYSLEDNENVSKAISAAVGDKGVDIVVIASHFSAIYKALNYINDGGTILIIGGIPKNIKLTTDEEDVDLYAIRHDDLIKKIKYKNKQITILGAHGTNEPLFRESIHSITSGKFERFRINPVNQISHIVSLQSLPDVFGLITKTSFIKNIIVGKVLIDFRLKGNKIYTLDEYKRFFPNESKQLLSPHKTKDLIKAINESLIDNKNYAKGSRMNMETINTFGGIRSLMDTLMDKAKLSPTDRIKLEKVFLFAQNAYEGMSESRKIRPDGSWFIYHPLEVALYVVKHLRNIDIDTLTGILLHDVIEYTNITLEDLTSEFGLTTANIANDLAQDLNILQYPTDKLVKRYSLQFRKQTNKNEIYNLALKKEHYQRLIKSPKYPLSPILKIIDNINNYSVISYLPTKKIKQRSIEELDLFKDFYKQVKFNYTLSERTIYDAENYLTQYYKIAQ